MGHLNQNVRSKQELIDQNAEFLKNLHPEDVEYTPHALDCIAQDSKAAAKQILETLKRTDLSALYYKAFPRDGDVVRVKDTLFRWQIAYFDRQGNPINTYEQVQQENIVDRVVTVLSPKDDEEIASKPFKL